MAKQTPLYDQHITSGAHTIDFHGWLMPLHYGSQLNEHHAVRNAAGLLDIPYDDSRYTQADLIKEWTYPYTRETAVFLAPWLENDKFWPSVKRLDDVYGDRNLFCACQPVQDDKD